MAAQRNTAPRPINQENPPANQAPAQGNRATPQRRSSRRQPGSNGYSDEDCMALVEIVKEVLPLGSNKWEQVHELYNEYARANGRTTRDAGPLKTKFKALFNSKKPTGNPNCPVHICEAKRANVMINEQAQSLAVVDDKFEEEESDDETNDIGNSAGHTQENEEVGQANEADQGNFGNFLDNPMDIGNDDGGDPINNWTCQPNNLQSMSGPIRSNQSQPSPGIPSIVAANTASPLPTLTRNRQSTNSQTQGNLQSSLAAFFDPEARRARDQEAGLTQFYALRLQESTSTVNCLQEEVNRLREGVNLQVIRLQEDLQQAQNALTQRTSENQDLRHRMEMMQLRMEFQQSTHYGVELLSWGWVELGGDWVLERLPSGRSWE
ncbi:hypothetical protein PSTT_12833 [Puccinia striiformis]|uniref:DUF6818 domain-containing protein n=1 Tax=Puccinia striiformis TaxID=27350 RepID=A0A2S4UUD3_9BASI|nr:hypothetical protein PSTT_12833 [Puccinia striiformis]